MGQASDLIGTSWLRQRVDAFNSMNQVEKAYAVGMILCAIGILAPAVRGAQAVSGPFLWAGGLFLVAALAREAYVIVEAHLEALWIKWLMVPLALMVGAYSLGSAANIVNTATGQDPGFFPRATAFMAPIAAIPAFALLVSVLASLALLIMFFAWLNQIASKEKSRGGGAWLWFGRIAAALATMSMVWPTIAAESGFGHGVERVARFVVQGLDMHFDQACAVSDMDRLVRINDELVVIARRTDGGVVFRRERCVLTTD